MKLSQRIRLLEVALTEREQAPDRYAGETAVAAGELDRKLDAISRSYLASPDSFPPWPERSSAVKLATAETPEQWDEVQALLAECVEQSKESQRRCEE